ncbi:Lysophospholipase [Fusarium falciforme]|uniref:Lysophospholipase n=1 Tax=Fusarium falciforme TaxID=195108 RepID=UPI002301E129|nr:Lysophospholipase [Fusarium falciforme]WAO96775.1 Lysophospholipase [Fusarium falciforme]
MVILTSFRQSPTYLYVKTYCLCALVTLFQATPVTSRLHLANQQPRLRSHGILTTKPSPHHLPRFRDQAGNIVQSSADSAVSVTAWRRVAHIVERWYGRAVDLAQVKALLKRDDQDLKTYPELRWDAQVRNGSSLHHKERTFIELRRRKISSAGDDSLRHFLDLPPGETVDPRDVPLVALGGSGGGYRAMYGLTGFISAAKKLGLWDCITWVAGVSGSCWTLAAYYTIARHDISRLVQHYLTVASELAHPMSIRALDMVARSKRGVYFLIGPLARKAQTSIIGLGIMDLYATLTTTYQLLSREPKGRLSRATFQWSKIWLRSGIDRGLEPMPILTAVRRVPRFSYGSKQDVYSTSSVKTFRAKGRIEKSQGSYSVTTASPAEMAVDIKPRPKRQFQWFEISPLEIGSPDLNRYIPTWAWGRTFISGHSIDRRPEQSFSLLLGQCTSAPAGPLTGYISTLLATMPKGTIMARILSLLNSFLSMKRWEGLWGNPIRAGHDPNPFYGLERPIRARVHTAERPLHGPERAKVHPEKNTVCDGIRSMADVPAADHSVTDMPWEAQGRTRLMDSGMSNNLPNHVLARQERGVDIFIAFDASSDVHTGAAIKRLHHFAADFHIEIGEETGMFHEPKQDAYFNSQSVTTHGSEIESTYKNHYAKVFQGTRRSGQQIYIVYCPLLPNGVNPGFNPSTASFSTSYNLMWTPDQIKGLLATSEANVCLYAAHTIRRVMRKVYEDKKAHRLASGVETTG